MKNSDLDDGEVLELEEMAAENEPAKLLLPYLQRADELQKHEPLVAYYCRLYAMERGLKIPQSERTKTTNALLVSLMKQLEKDKKSLQLGPDDNLHLEGFALNVFSKADKQDRAGRADLNTAKTFYAASIFFEILNQFGPVQPDLEEKQKYAAWKAADIRKALKEGRKPTPGPPGSEKDLPNVPPAQSKEQDLSRSDSVNRPEIEHNSSSPIYDNNSQHFSNRQSSTDNIPPPAPTVPSGDDYQSYNVHDYQSYNVQQPPPSHNSGNPSYSQPYNHQPYMQEPLTHMPHNYPSHDAPSYSYPNFQSYPSFADSSLPAAPSHQPSYYQGSDVSYHMSSAPMPTNYSSASLNNLNDNNGPASVAASALTKTYQYDSNYQPPPEKISEAHKAARFAVGALAFDDVSVAVDYLKKSLELLTNPSAGN